jgi:hypothetical protein
MLPKLGSFVCLDVQSAHQRTTSTKFLSSTAINVYCLNEHTDDIIRGSTMDKKENSKTLLVFLPLIYRKMQKYASTTMSYFSQLISPLKICMPYFSFHAQAYNHNSSSAKLGQSISIVNTFIFDRNQLLPIVKTIINKCSDR